MGQLTAEQGERRRQHVLADLPMYFFSNSPVETVSNLDTLQLELHTGKVTLDEGGLSFVSVIENNHKS